VSLSRTVNEVRLGEGAESAGGGRWVVFEYCISLVAVTFRQQSRPFFIEADGISWVRSLPYVLVSLLFGWWGLPWGVIYTPVTIFTNLTGGCDITAQVREVTCADEPPA
jgi:hypothetical protein